MKSLNNYINEARGSRMDAPSTIYFPTLSSYLIYEFEVSGQISDGYWENSRPANHWRWISNVTPIIDENHEIGYNGPKHSRKYDCSWITSELSKALNGTNNDYMWLKRVMNYGHAGLVLDKSIINKFGVDSYPIRAMIEKLPEEPITQDEFVETLSEHQLKYWEKAKGILTKSFFKKYYSTNYGMRDLKVDLADMQEAINTQLGEVEE